MHDIEDRVAKVVVDALGSGAEAFRRTGTLSDYGADSLDGVEIVMLLEEEFGIEISVESIAVDSRFEDVVAAVK